MGSSCCLIPRVKNAKGEFVESKLFKDLLDITKDRDKASRFYNIATSERFLNADDIYNANFDENGQITAHSFLSLTKLLESDDAEIQALEKKYGLKNVQYEEAVSEVERFNKNEATKDYILFIDDNDNTYSTKVAKRNEETAAKLEEIIENNEIAKALANSLKNLGVAYDFVGTDKFEGRFSTKNAKLAADGYMHLIQISTGGDVVGALAEESAHLAIAAMRNTDVVKRLLSAITEQNINKLFTQEEISLARGSSDTKLELAGVLVKKMLLKQEPTGFSALFSRVKNAIVSIFQKANLDKFLSAKTRAKMYAQRIAAGFLYNESDFSIDKALESPVTLYSGDITIEAQKLKNTLQQIGILSTKMRNASDAIYKVYADLTFDKVLDGETLETVERETAAALTSSAVSTLTDRLSLVLSTLNDATEHGLDINNIAIVNYYLEAIELYHTLNNIKQDFETVFASENLTPSIKKIRDSYDSIIKLINKNAEAKLLQTERLVTGAFLEQVFGAISVRQNARIAFKDGKLTRIEEKNYTFSGTSELGRQNIVAEGSLDFYNPFLGSAKITRFLANIRSYSNAEDLTVQLLNKALMKVKVNQNRMYQEALSELENIKKIYKGNPADFYERTSDGNLSGYFISETNLSQFFFEKKNITDKVKDKFIKKLKEEGSLNYFNSRPRSYKKAVFDAYLEQDAEYQKWVAEAYSDYKNGIPNSNRYHNKVYDELIKDKTFKEALDRLKELKKRIDDDYLTEFETTDNGERIISAVHFKENRVPMFTGSQAAAGKNWADNYETFDLYAPNESITRELTSSNFGSEETEVDPFFSDPYSEVRNKMHRIPLYGIRELEDMSRLSTDIFTSMAMYANMAFKFGSLQGIYSYVEIAIDTLNKRSWQDKHAAEISQHQFEELEDKFIYYDSKTFNKLGKVIKTLGSWASLRVLGMSIRGARKNLGGGYTVVANDALAGNAPFTAKDLWAVTMQNKVNARNKLQTLGEYTVGVRAKDKWTKLQRRWSAYRGENVENKIQQKSKAKKFGNQLVKLWMANYSISDDKLLGIIYGAAFHNLQLYDTKTGKTINGLDAYFYDEDNNPHLKDGILTSKNHAKYYEVLKNALAALAKIEYNGLQEPADLEALGDLQDFITSPQFGGYKELDFDIKDFRFKATEKNKQAIDELVKKLNNAITENHLQFTQDEEFDVIYKINDYVMSSQGIYGAINATAFQSAAYLETIARMKGYLFGNIQRNLLSNSSINSIDYKNSMLGAELIALASVTGIWHGKAQKDLTLSNSDSKRLGWNMLAALVIPFAIKDPKTRKFLRGLGYSDDLLNKICANTIGIWILYILKQLGIKLFGRGNQKAYATMNFASDAGEHKKKNLEEPGLIFKYIDEHVVPLMSSDFKKTKNAIKNLSEEKKMYRDYYSKLAEWKNITYGDPDNPWGFANVLYSLLGQEFSYLQGVTSEQSARINPIYFIADIKNAISSPVIKSGLLTRTKRVFENISQANAVPGQTQLGAMLDALEREGLKEVNFLLNKIDMELTPVEDYYGDIIEYKPTLRDPYEKQNAISRMEKAQTY